MNTKKEISLRPHHALCILLFSSDGHSTAYSEIMYKLIDITRKNRKQQITLSMDHDMICGHCPYNENGICSKSDEVISSDNNILAFCNLKTKDRLVWDDLRRSLTTNILMKGRLEQACKGCQYLPQCETIRRKKVQIL